MRNSFFKYSLLAVSLALLSFKSQDGLTFKNVYHETKTDGSWSGTKKTRFTANVSELSKGGPYSLTMKDQSGSVSYRVVVNYQTESSDGRAFHQVVGGVWGESNWTSPSGDTSINWVFMNKDISKVLEDDPKPFDIEIQFGDGSAVKYYISP